MTEDEQIIDLNNQIEENEKELNWLEGLTK